MTRSPALTAMVSVSSVLAVASREGIVFGVISQPVARNGAVHVSPSSGKWRRWRPGTGYGRH